MDKILFLHTSRVQGGAELSLIELLHNLGNKGLDLHLVFSSTYPFDLQQKLPSVVCHPICLTYPCCKSSLKEWVSLLYVMLVGAWQIYRLVENERFSTVYCNTCRTLYYCVFVKLFTSIHIICHCRDRVYQKREPLFIRWIADKVIAVSAYISAQIPTGMEKYVVYNGVDFSRFIPYQMTGWLKRKYGLNPNVCCIGNIGQIVRWKNQWDFLRVARQLLRTSPDFHFFILGEVVDKTYFFQLKSQITYWGMEKYITLTGHVDPIEIYMAELDMIMHTAVGEPFGRVLIEAAAMEKPVVAYASGGPVEVIENAKTGYLVGTGKVEDMVEKIRLLATSRELRRTIGNAARMEIVRRFGVDRYVMHIHRILTI